MKLRTLLVNLALLILTGLVVTAVSAQELCETLVRDAWELVTENCEGVGGDNACYGHDSLTATFNVSAPEAAFARPGDQNALQNLHTIRTQAFDEADEEWGIGDFLIPAETFGGTADQNIIIFTAGDVIVENAAEADSGQAPMKSFNFTTGGSSDCREAPNTVFIQSPHDLKVDLQINSTPVRIGSTIAMGTDVDPETGFDVMWFGVLEGSLTLYPDSPKEQVIPAGGFTTTLLSDEEGHGLDNESIITSGRVPVLDRVTGEPILGLDGEPFYRQAPITSFTEPQAITLTGEGYTGWGAYQFVNLIPPELLVYAVKVPDSTTLVDDSAPASGNPKPTTTATVSALVTNWCDPGGKWDDGRCNTSDPFLTDWYYNAGWYNAALENGLIDAIPPQYQSPPATATAIVPPTSTLTRTPSNTPTITLTPSNTPTFTFTPSNTPTFTLTPSNTPTFTLTPSLTWTPSITPLPPFDAVVTGCTLQPDTTYNIDVTWNNVPPGTDLIKIYQNGGTIDYYWGGEGSYTFNRTAAELPFTAFEPRDVNYIVLANDSSLGSIPPCTN